LFKKGKHLLVHINPIKPYLMSTSAKTNFDDKMLTSQHPSPPIPPPMLKTPTAMQPEQMLDGHQRAQSPLSFLFDDPSLCNNPPLLPPMPQLPAPPTIEIQTPQNDTSPRQLQAKRGRLPKSLPSTSLPSNSTSVYRWYSCSLPAPVCKALTVPQFSLHLPISAPPGGGKRAQWLFML
jgi:hypothetical protein